MSDGRDDRPPLVEHFLDICEDDERAREALDETIDLLRRNLTAALEARRILEGEDDE